jgi:PAS domain S-box-containing protein
MADTVEVNSKYAARFLLELHRKALILPEKELYEYFLDHAVKVTKSKIGFFHIVTDNQKETKLTAWNKEALKTCNANYADHYPVEQAGNWADCIRFKRPIIYNHFQNSPNQKGLPEGHVTVKRILSVPILDNGKVIAIFGVGNKTQLYHKEDTHKLELIAKELNSIANQRKLENELRESKEKYHSLFANMLDGFAYCKMIFNLEGKPVDFVYLEVNDAFEVLTGLKRELVVGKNVTEAIPGIREANPELLEIYGRVASTGKQERFEVFFKPLNIWLAISVYSPEKGYFAAVFDNITDRKKAEEKLEEYSKNLEKLVEERTKKLALSSLYARNLIEASLDPLVTINAEGKITDVNKATEIATGRSRDELNGSDFSSYFVEPEKARIGYKRVFSEGIIKDYPLAIRHRNGNVVDVLYNATVYRNEEGQIQGVFAAARDISELKKAEANAREAEKKMKDSERLAAIGATAGMVGHDIRNPLQAITGDVFLAKTELTSMPESEERKNALENLTEIEKNIDYINKIVADLQDFARPLKPNTEETDLKLIIDELLSKNGLPGNVEVNVRVESDARKFVADSTYISRMMFNLMNNAVQAMPQGGKLTINAYKEANDVIITVKDTGIGIPEAVKEKLFTPMFTTKAKGQGFGLAVIKRMTESLGGTVSFESQEGKGTTFTVRLPPQQLNGKLAFK